MFRTISLGVTARDYFFPLRNRIVAGLSQAVLIIEAPIKSGALITARCAIDYGRDVFVVPGDLDRTANDGDIY